MPIPIVINPEIIYTNSTGDQYRIIEELPAKYYTNHGMTRMVRVEFIKTHYTHDLSLQNAINGKAIDYTEFNKIFGDKFITLKNTLSPLDRCILKLLYNILNRCYNPKNSDYYRYGGVGVTVADEWRDDPLQFIHDFKLLPGYQDWLNASDDQKYNYHIDKDMLQQNIPMNQRVYGPKTCVIIHNQLNGRLRHVLEKKKKYTGIFKDPYANSWSVEIRQNNIEYKLGVYSSERAAASVFNYIAKQLPNTILNDIEDGEMPIEEALTYLTSRVPINVPSGIELPAGVQYIHDGSVYTGVKKTANLTYQAWAKDDQGKDILLDTYNTEIAAANAVNRYYRNHNQPLPNILIIKNIMTDEQIDAEHVLTRQEIMQYRHRKFLEMRFAERYEIGHTYINDKGRPFTILERPNIDDVKKRHFPVKIRYEDTGEVFILSSSTVEKMYTISHDRKRHLKQLSILQDEGLIDKSLILKKKAKKKDPNIPSVYGVGYLGDSEFPKELKYKMYKLLWVRMYNAISNFGKDISNLSKIDSRWYNFSWFVEDITSLPGYQEWSNNGYPTGYALENRSMQMNVPLDQRIWSKDTCTIMDKNQARFYMYRDRYAPINNQLREDQYRGVCKRNYRGKDGGVFWVAKIAKFGNNSYINIGTFNDPKMAAAAVDYYSQFYNGVFFNGIGDSIPPSEWQAHKSGIKPLYHLEQRSLYQLTNEDEEARKARCKQLYGIDI